MHCMSYVCRTYKELLFVNENAFKHFKVLKTKYHKATHHKGQVFVRDKMALRRVTDEISKDTGLRHGFDMIPYPNRFSDADTDIVFQKYVARMETLFGNEVARQLLEKVKRSKASCLESLRELKSKKKIAGKK